jgi:hypothetical protein
MATINRPGKSIASGSEIQESKDTVYIAIVFTTINGGTYRKIYPCANMAEADRMAEEARSFSDVQSARILGI